MDGFFLRDDEVFSPLFFVVVGLLGIFLVYLFSSFGNIINICYDLFIKKKQYLYYYLLILFQRTSLLIVSPTSLVGY